MANTFYQPEQVAQTAVALAVEDSYLGALVNRNYENDLFGGGGKGRTVNIRVPAALVARERGIDDKTTQIIVDELTEQTIPLTLGTHAYSAVSLSEGDMTLNLQSFAAQVLAPQVAAVVDDVEYAVLEALIADGQGAQAGETLPTWNPSAPLPFFTALRKILRDRGVPAANVNVVVGTEVYANLIDAQAITDATASGSTAALRDGQVGRLRGFTIVEDNRVPETGIAAFHSDAFTLAVRAPLVPAGVSFGASESSNGFSLRYIRDYAPETMVDRSVVSTFAGVAKLPLYKVTRTYNATTANSTASVTEVPGGAALYVDTADAGS